MRITNGISLLLAPTGEGKSSVAECLAADLFPTSNPDDYPDVPLADDGKPTGGCLYVSNGGRVPDIPPPSLAGHIRKTNRTIRFR